MKKQLNQILMLVFVYSVSLTSCNNTNQTEHIVCTTNIVSDLINQIKPPSISIMGPGTDPHLYKSKSGDHQLLNDAKVIVYSGLHLEGKLTDALENLEKKKKVINLSAGINSNDLIRSADFGGSSDPHFWFDIDLYKNAVIHTSKELKNSFPLQKSIIENNTNNYLKKIDSTSLILDNIINQLPVKQRILITAHDAFNYFGKRYNFTVKGVQGASTAAEAGLKDITNLVNYIINNNVPAIFVESSVSERNINAILEGCRNKGHQVKLGGLLYSDALGDVNGNEGTYLSMMTYNIRTIANALLSKTNE